MFGWHRLEHFAPKPSSTICVTECLLGELDRHRDCELLEFRPEPEIWLEKIGSWMMPLAGTACCALNEVTRLRSKHYAKPVTSILCH